MDLMEIFKLLENEGNAENREGMARFGINVEHAYGVSIPRLRKIAKEPGKSHALAQELWESSVHESKILACLVDDPLKVTEGQMEKWVMDFDSWDICDLCCGNLFDRTPLAFRKAFEWSSREEEFVKRAGFVLMAALSVHDKKADNEEFLDFLPVIKKEATDGRNFVRKAVNWSLRQIGKRNAELNIAAIQTAKELQAMESKSAKWIASDAIRELTGMAVRSRLSE
jgi:3-methyladenine DNA glycosylase AlkD